MTWVAIAVLGLLLPGCQQPEIDPPAVDSGVDSLVVIVADSGEIVDAQPAEVTPDVASDASGDASAELADAAEDLVSDKPPTSDAIVEMPSVDVPPEGGAPDTMAIGPCAAGSPPLAPTGWTATASVQSPGDVPTKAFDGQLASRWSTGIFAAIGHSFRLDLRTARTINRIQLDTGVMYPLDFPRGYALTLSADDVTYHQVAAGAGTQPLTTISFPAESARYVRITLTARTPQNWWGISELIVCGY